MRVGGRRNPEINSSSMADIAFLLLIFFLVTTTIVNDKGILLLLPPKNTDIPLIVEINERNIFKIRINSSNQILVEGEKTDDLVKMKVDIQAFVLNYGKDKKSSESPLKAVVSIKTNRGTSYEKFVAVLNAVQGVYHDIYANNISLSNEEYRNLDFGNPDERRLIIKAKNGIPMNISIAEPSNL
ncbi:MAG: biopolymer transporter ExbD [Cyclobacteriaceae bacterium]|nr:biopolymer transporter ExbD [Cyclobacteriaceae bacterium]